MGKLTAASFGSILWPMGGVLSGSLLIAWATEVLSFFLSRGMAFALLALLQVLPEFAVEAVITYEASQDVSKLQFVTANFTGANRLIVGLFLPLVFFMASYRARRAGSRINVVTLPRESSIEVVALILATLYSFSFVFRSEVGIADAVVLIGLYATYLYMTYHLPPSAGDEHSGLPLVPRKIRAQTLRVQKWVIFVLFLIGGTLLFVSVHPFYENTIELGFILGISAYFLLQWMAPFLSEFPEFITILYWGRTGRAQLGLTNAISSKVNQWTLLIAMIPLVYLYGTYRAGAPLYEIHFDDAQRLEVLLTAAQGLFAAACFLNLRFHRWEAWTLLGLWAVQLLDPLIDPHLPNLPHVFNPPEGQAPHYIREWTTWIYFALTPFVLLVPRYRFAAARGFREVWRRHFAKGPAAAVATTTP